MMNSVKRILFRRSGTLNMFRRLESTGRAPGQRRGRAAADGRRSAVGELVALGRRTAVAPRQGQDLDRTAGGGDGCLGRLGEGVGLDGDRAGELAPAEHLDQGALVDEALARGASPG